MPVASRQPMLEPVMEAVLQAAAASGRSSDLGFASVGQGEIFFRVDPGMPEKSQHLGSKLMGDAIRSKGGNPDGNSRRVKIKARATRLLKGLGMLR